MGRVKQIWYLTPMRAAKVQASLRICAVSPEPPLLAHISSESRGTFRQKARSLTPLNGWTCAVTVCHDGMLEDTNSLDGAHMFLSYSWLQFWDYNNSKHNKGMLKSGSPVYRARYTVRIIFLIVRHRAQTLDSYRVSMIPLIKVLGTSFTCTNSS